VNSSGLVKSHGKGFSRYLFLVGHGVDCKWILSTRNKNSRWKTAFFSSNFPVVEIDSSYHFLPTRRNLEAWINATPDGFKFDVKAFSLLTGHSASLSSLPEDMRGQAESIIKKEGNFYLHHFNEEMTNKLWERFDRAILPLFLSGKLGAITFQFPPWFHPRSENYKYIAQCKLRLSRYPVAVEFRTGSWVDSEHEETTLKFLRANRLALVCVDEPQGLKTSLPPIAEATASFAVIRFHGRNRENWERTNITMNEKYNYLYTEKELKEWVGKIKRISSVTDEVFVIFKNKHRDYSVRNAQQMIELLKADTGLFQTQLKPSLPLSGGTSF
jgi:uncharacterized protein YecE (DUF72 family)